jgi:AraC family transcriptional regulator
MLTIEAQTTTSESAATQRMGLSVDLCRTAGGLVELSAAHEHRLKVHAGSAVSGSCGAQRFVYTRGDVDIIPAGVSDTWEEDEPSSSLILRLSPWLLRRAASDMGKTLGDETLEPRHQFRDPQIEHIAWALGAAHEAGYPGGLVYTESLGLALAAHLLGGYARATERPHGLQTVQRRRLLRYIDEHIDQDLSLLDLSEVARVSASHLKTLFKRSMGVPVHEYVIQRRVERAKQLLQGSKLSISQIAIDSGFAHPSHMARCMRRVLGVTPKTLRGG